MDWGFLVAVIKTSNLLYVFRICMIGLLTMGTAYMCGRYLVVQGRLQDFTDGEGRIWRQRLKLERYALG